MDLRATRILFTVVLASLLPLACHPRPAGPNGAPAAGATPVPAVIREILALPARETTAGLRLRTRLELLESDAASLDCAEFIRSSAVTADRVRVVEFLAGLSWPALVDALIDAVGRDDSPKALVLAGHRALCAMSFFRVELDPELHYEARRALVARDWGRWWLANRQTSPSERLARRLPDAVEAERLNLIQGLSRVGDPAAVPTLMRFVDSGTLEFRARALLTISYLTNTVFLEEDTLALVDERHPQEIRLLDAITRCQEWWRGAAERPPETWIRDGFRARGYGLHTPPVVADLDALLRAMEDRHPAVRSQALRHLVRWTGQSLVEDASAGVPAFRSMAAQWRAWLEPRRERLTWDPETERFVETSAAAER